ncbi:hypothetical protein VTN77DRAFT_3012 [Rasamsonia byssochlamydoides]|uniref:uncharacterized protein n=1 Tax=Rasamsonia byssochlamydoides TaxID=89139 RepID=UPI0037443A51
MTTEWSLDFCLVCDRQTLGGAYCSQACRLAELDQFFPESGLSSPTNYNNTQPMFGANTPRSPLTSIVDFPVGHAPAVLTSQMPVSPGHGASKQLLNSTQYLTHGLTLSSSQTSLSSLRSNASQSSTLSDYVRNELRDYASCFDQVRDWKRRLTT